MSMLSNRKAFLPLTTNTKYHAILLSYTEYEPTETTKQTRPDSQGFITFHFELQEDGRPFSDSRSFPVGTDLLSKQLLLQTGLPNATEQVDLFRTCIEKKLPLDVWVVQNGTYNNYTFQEPTNPTATDTAAQAVDGEGTFK